jgi:preprotein translocase subunit SecD
MILYYRLPGLLSALALIFYAALVLALFKLIPVTLTLAGIAGFILSVGMAVDANVLIFERTKEELRLGKPLGSAIDEGFKRAWPSIRDGNITTLISCLILFWFSTSTIKGFALTLSVGVIMGMFSALFITRSFLHLIEPWILRTWWFGVREKK